MGLRSILDNLEPHFVKGGKFEKMYPLYEAIDTGRYRRARVRCYSSH